MLVVLLATMAIRPLRCPRPHAEADVPLAEEVGHEVLDAMAQSSPEGTRDDAEPAQTASGGTASPGVLRDRRHDGV